MPGQALDIDIPLSTEPFYPAFVKIIAAIQTMQTDLEAKVVPSEIDFSQGEVDLAGNDLLGAQSIQLEPAPAVAGYPSGAAIVVDGEWYLVTDDGAVQVTSGGDLNAAGIGGIVGDYGGANPAAVAYVDSDEVYEFTDAPGDWSDVACDSVILHDDTSGVSITLSVEPDTGGNARLFFGGPPPSGTYPVIMTSGGDIGWGTNWNAAINVSGNITLAGGADLILTGASTVTAGSNVFDTSAVTVGGSGGLSLGASADLHRAGSWEHTVLPNIGMKEDIDTAAIGGNTSYGLTLGAGKAIRVPFQVHTGDRITSMRASLLCSGGTDTMQVDIAVVGPTGTVTSLYSAAQAVTASLTAYTFDVTDHTFAAGEALSVKITAPAGQTGGVGPVVSVTTRP